MIADHQKNRGVLAFLRAAGARLNGCAIRPPCGRPHAVSCMRLSNVASKPVEGVLRSSRVPDLLARSPGDIAHLQNQTGQSKKHAVELLPRVTFVV